MNNKIKKYFFFSIGFCATALGIIGAFVPLMPTTCFLIVAVWAFSKSNPEIAKKILSHPQFGSTIANWMTYKSIDRKTKCTISLSIVIGFSITLLITTPSTMLSAFLISGMLMLLLYINTRSEHSSSGNSKHTDKIDLSFQKVVSVSKLED
jgi:uncharacterized protein